VIEMAEAGETAVVDREVFTLNVDGPYAPGAGFVMPATVRVSPVWVLLTEQSPAPPSVINTAFDVVLAEATVQPPKLLPSVTVGDAGTVKFESN